MTFRDSPLPPDPSQPTAVPEDAGEESPAWLDRDAGPIVRPFALTGGRAHSGYASFDLLAHVVTTEAAADLASMLPPEQRAILRRAAQPASVAEIASHLDLPVGVVRVLLGDLLAQHAVAVYEPAARSYLTNDHILSAVIDGLRAL